jgi:citrate lyase subunit beta/citryl-CoA lyase
VSPSLAHSLLFVPATRPDRIGKALQSGAHAVIVDLEDAVPAADKAGARAALLRHVDPSRPVWVRVNGWGTPWFEDDVGALALQPGVAGLMLPKAETVEQIAALGQRGGPQFAIMPIVETARGFINLDALCAAPGVYRIVFGTLDFKNDLGIEGDGEELLMFSSRIVLGSRLGGLAPPVYGVTTSIDDPSLAEADARRARRLGFGGKLCIHPNQVAAVNNAFAWSASQREWAVRIIASVERGGEGAVALDGEMVDLPVIAKARQILAES